MNPLGALITVILCIIVAAGSRKAAIIGVVLGVCYLTQGQSVLFAAFNFTSIRIILLVGTIRVLVRGEHKQLRFTAIDRVLLIYTIYLFVANLIRVPSTETLVYQLGILYNVLLSYFVARGLIQSGSDTREFLSGIAFLLIPLSIFMIAEARSGKSVFVPFGGFVEEMSVVRDGKVRCQGPFRQAITAGAFGATLGLLYCGLLFAKTGKRATTIIGLLASVAILVAAHSSGPLLGFIIGLVALAAWPMRRRMRLVRWSMIISLVLLHLIMKDPVWFLLARVGDLIGGGGYHRAYLIDRFVGDFDAWWLIGSDNTAHWFPYLLENGRADITNQFVSDGLNGGILGLFLSVLLMVQCYKHIGRALERARSLEASGERYVWSMGALLTGSIGILISVTYFDQMHVIWYLVLACIVAASAEGTDEPYTDAEMRPATAR